MKAYQNLGEDLQHGNPQYANNLLVSMAAAVVRNEIANTTINEIMKNRDYLRKQIRSKIGKVAHGWGIWLETVEITDVKIQSRSLYQDMQCDFREDQRKNAEIQKIEKQHDITTNGYEIEFSKKQKDSERDFSDKKAAKQRNVQTAKRALEEAKKLVLIEHQNKQRQLQNEIQKLSN